MKPFVLTALGVTLLFGFAGPSSAQTVEAAPLAGYRFNNDLFEAATNRPVDSDGAPVVGGVVNVGMGGGLWFEALFTRQEAEVPLPSRPVRRRRARALSSISGWPAAVRNSECTVPARFSPDFSG